MIAALAGVGNFVSRVVCSFFELLGQIKQHTVLGRFCHNHMKQFIPLARIPPLGSALSYPAQGQRALLYYLSSLLPVSNAD
ncbi:hypothetical protein ACTL6P_15785 [Endozoicomonas acroporae]|uniref:hypothetical protein n=1 Tax=Endozoicomonas acroporae TaxID=1701104 RepID=UPI0011AEE0C0|nr:hypothetical protein [Endozoicomonas acroporae]